MKLSIISSSLNLTILIRNIFALISSSKTNWVYPEIITIPLILQFNVITFKRITLQYLQNKTPRTPIDVIKKIFPITYISSKIRLTVSESEDKEMDAIKISRRILKYSLLRAINKFLHDQKLRILQICLSLMESQNFEISNFYLAKIRKIQGKTSLVTLNLFYKLQENMNRLFSERRKEMLDIQKYLKHEALSDSFTKAVQNHLTCYLDFWDHYLLPETKIQQI